MAILLTLNFHMNFRISLSISAKKLERTLIEIMLNINNKFTQDHGENYCDIEWFALEMNRDHSFVFETASKYCISDSLVNYEGYSISSKEFLNIVVDIMVI